MSYDKTTEKYLLDDILISVKGTKERIQTVHDSIKNIKSKKKINALLYKGYIAGIKDMAIYGRTYKISKLKNAETYTSLFYLSLPFGKEGIRTAQTFDVKLVCLRKKKCGDFEPTDTCIAVHRHALQRVIMRDNVKGIGENIATLAPFVLGIFSIYLYSEKEQRDVKDYEDFALITSNAYVVCKSKDSEEYEDKVDIVITTYIPRSQWHDKRDHHLSVLIKRLDQYPNTIMQVDLDDFNMYYNERRAIPLSATYEVDNDFDRTLATVMKSSIYMKENLHEF